MRTRLQRGKKGGGGSGSRRKQGLKRGRKEDLTVGINEEVVMTEEVST